MFSPFVWLKPTACHLQLSNSLSGKKVFFSRARKQVSDFGHTELVYDGLFTSAKTFLKSVNSKFTTQLSQFIQNIASHIW